MNFDQRRLKVNSFVICNFSYYPVVWMIHRQKLIAGINKLSERALQVVYRDFRSSFEELLRGGSSLSLYQQNLQKLKRYLKLKLE